MRASYGPGVLCVCVCLVVLSEQDETCVFSSVGATAHACIVDRRIVNERIE
jgi:hypothetical protein